MRKQNGQHHPPPRYAYLLAAGKSGLEVIGTAFTQSPSGKTVLYGFDDRYGFNVLGKAVINRDWKWRKLAWNVPAYTVKEEMA